MAVSHTCPDGDELQSVFVVHEALQTPRVLHGVTPSSQMEPGMHSTQVPSRLPVGR